MKNDPLPLENHVSRYCGFSHLDPETGLPSATAFMLRPADTDRAVSVNWLELLAQTRAEQLNLVRKALDKKMHLAAKASFAVLNVGRAIEAVRIETGEQYSISILHNPDINPGQWDDESHSGIYGLPDDTDEAAVALAGVIAEVYRARGE